MQAKFAGRQALKILPGNSNGLSILIYFKFKLFAAYSFLLRCCVERMNMAGPINFANIPGNSVSGLSDGELSWVSEQSMDRFMSELDEGFLKEFEFEEEDKSFQHVDDTIVEEMNKAERQLTPQATEKQTKTHVQKFKKFLLEKNLSTEIESMPSKYLAEYLRFFYFNLRTKSGEPYSPNSLVGIRAAIHRYLTSADVGRQDNILTDRSFTRANATLKVMVKLWLKSGKSSNKFPPIDDNDMKKIKNFFDRSNSEILQQEVWFNITWYFGLRGRETVSQLNKHSFEIDEDGEGRKFASINHNVLSKNIKASLSNTEFENLKTVRMYDNPNDESLCPVKSLEIYLEKIPESCTHLFPQPVKNKKASAWYCEKRSLGKNPLGEMMQTISKAAGLSRMYTNHCVRVSVVSELHQQGFSAEDICTVTGHRSTGSVRNYVRIQKDHQKRKISEALQMGRSCSSVEVTQKILQSNNEIIVRNQENLPLVLNFSGNFENCTFTCLPK